MTLCWLVLTACAGNWGDHVLEAANRACNTFVEHIAAQLNDVTETKKMKDVLVDAMKAAHLSVRIFSLRSVQV